MVRKAESMKCITAITIQVDGELLSQLEKGGNINLLVDSAIFTPKSSDVPIVGDAAAAAAAVPVPDPAEENAAGAVPPPNLDPTSVGAAVTNPSNLPAISPAVIEGLSLNAKKDEEHHVRHEGKYCILR